MCRHAKLMAFILLRKWTFRSHVFLDVLMVPKCCVWIWEGQACRAPARPRRRPRHTAEPAETALADSAGAPGRLGCPGEKGRLLGRLPPGPSATVRPPTIHGGIEAGPQKERARASDSRSLAEHDKRTSTDAGPWRRGDLSLQTQPHPWMSGGDIMTQAVSISVSTPY